MAEFFMILPHGPNCWMGLGAFRERVRLGKKGNNSNMFSIITGNRK